MTYNVVAIPRFKKELKQLVKKFHSLINEYNALIEKLEEEPHQGTPLGNDCYKIRLAIASKGKGKSGGARVITQVYVAHNTVYLLSIYDKSEHENISDKDLLALIKTIK